MFVRKYIDQTGMRRGLKLNSQNRYRVVNGPDRRARLVVDRKAGEVNDGNYDKPAKNAPSRWI